MDALPTVLQSAHEDVTWAILIHLQITGGVLLSAAAVGLPLALSLSHMSIASRLASLLYRYVVRTPTMAGVALIAAGFGAGIRAAIAILFLTALLPILTQTLLALGRITPSIPEAAHGMGLSWGTRLFTIRIPLVLSDFLASLRKSALLTFGVVTLCALLGMGGLGSLILRGITLWFENQDEGAALLISAGGLLLLIGILLNLLFSPLLFLARRRYPTLEHPRD